MRSLGRTGVLFEIEQGIGELTVHWEVRNFFSLSAKGGDFYDSPDFRFSDADWCLRMFSNGDEEPSGCVGLFLLRRGKGAPVTVPHAISITGAEGVGKRLEGVRRFSKYRPMSGWSEFVSRDILWDHDAVMMPYNLLTITCSMKTVAPSPVGGFLLPSCHYTPNQTDGESKESSTSTRGSQSSNKQDASTQTVEKFRGTKALGKENNSSGIQDSSVEEAEDRQSPEKQGVEELAESLQRLLAGGEDSDVLVKVRGKEFPAHRVILRARSPVFQAMFAHDMVEKQSGVVTMEDCDPESFPAFLQHVYTGSTEMISVDNVFSLYTACDKYDLSALKKACTKFMKNNLTVSCVCDAIALGVKHDEEELIHCATEFFCSNALEIFKTVEWQIFLKENTTIGNELLIKAFSK